jgi:hypothetical protein
MRPCKVLAEPRFGDSKTTNCIPQSKYGDENLFVHHRLEQLFVVGKPLLPEMALFGTKVFLVFLVDGREVFDEFFLQQADLRYEMRR